MPQLKTICPEDIAVPPGLAGHEIRNVRTDSRRVEDGDLLMCPETSRENAAQYVRDAFHNGAAVVVCEEGVFPADACPQKVLMVRGIAARVPEFLSRAYPLARKIKLTGITGTNGKTTITYLLESIWSACGFHPGVIGTVAYRYGDQILPAKNTTPGIADNYCLLAAMARAGVTHCAMEVSSHALDQGRVRGLNFDHAVFTNLTRDHLDYHAGQEAYFAAKARLFNGEAEIGRAVINVDDASAGRLIELTSAQVTRYGIDGPADIAAHDLCLDAEGLRFTLAVGKEKILLSSALAGRHNVYNILAAAAVCCHQGIDLKDIARGIAARKIIPGRLERVGHRPDQPAVFVDYAHTDDALRNVLRSLKALQPGRLIVVFGCGGDRDRGKRSRMARAAEQYAQDVIVTNDNPRSEDPDQILADIESGFQQKQYVMIKDRGEAIGRAIDQAGPRDIVLIAGKGHEDYQTFADRTIHFDDREVAAECLNRKRKQAL
ncbi:MAG: UDP-N-acetylmuramoyl-L-alanyl-D-glutamate--2,6-diaminopimelate ligase [Candidatus Omnitrophota bacterium]